MRKIGLHRGSESREGNEQPADAFMITRRLLCAGAALAPLSASGPAFAQGDGRFPAAWLQGIRQEAAQFKLREPRDMRMVGIKPPPQDATQTRVGISWSTSYTLKG